MRLRRCLLSWVLLFALLASDFSGVGLKEVQAEENNIVIGDSGEGDVLSTDTIFNNEREAFGFDTDLPEEGETSGDDGTVNPYGVDNYVPNPVSEIYSLAAGTDGNFACLFGHNIGIDLDGVTSDDDFVIDEASKRWTLSDDDLFDANSFTAGDFTGDGKDNQLFAMASQSPSGDNLLAYAYFNDPWVGEDVDISDGYQVRNLIWDTEVTSSLGNRLTVEPLKEQYYRQQNYLQATVGDFTGDGIDEIAYYVPEFYEPKIVVFQLQLTQSQQAAVDSAIENGDSIPEYWKDWTNWKKIWNYNIDISDNYVPNMVSVVAGDLDDDGVEDLALSWGYFQVDNKYEELGCYYPDPATFVESKGVVAFGDRDGYN